MDRRSHTLPEPLWPLNIAHKSFPLCIAACHKPTAERRISWQLVSDSFSRLEVGGGVETTMRHFFPPLEHIIFQPLKLLGLHPPSVPSVLSSPSMLHFTPVPVGL